MKEHRVHATDPKQNAVVHAAAGTGKTWLLVSRIIRLLLQGASPGSILAITFTRKAAAEMHIRLRQRLLAMCEANDDQLTILLHAIGAAGTPDERRRARTLYEELLTDPHDLRATTFHAFCQELLSRFPFEAGIPPGFDLIEQTMELEAAAWRALDSDLIRNSDEVDIAMDSLLRISRGLPNAREALRDFLTHRSDWWAYTEGASDPIAYATQKLRQTLEVDLTADPLSQFASDTAFRSVLKSFVDGFKSQASGKYEVPVAQAQQALSADIEPAEFFGLLCRTFLRVDGQPRVFTITKALNGAVGAAGATALTQSHADIVARLQAVIEQQHRLETLSRTQAWYTVGQRLLEHFQRLKREQNLIDFTDLEWLTYRMLSQSRHAEWIQYKLDQRINHLLVDEFQDTNPTQWRLLLPLLQEMASAQTDRARSVFLVGDEKQSIYRFRRADPDLLQLARVWLETHMGARTYEQHVSWRSSPAIMHFVNLLFETPAADAPADASASQPSGDGSDVIGFRLQNFRAHETRHQDLWGHAEVLPLIAQNPTVATVPYFRNPLQQPRLVEEQQQHRLEGDMVADKIRAILAQPIRVHGQVRPMQYSDILILLRDRNHAASYDAALRHAGIPYVGAGRGTFLDCLEVRDVVHLLTVLLTPLDDLALASVLRSPIFAASDSDLIALAGDDAPSAWYERLIGNATDRGGQDRSEPLARAARLLPQWRALADRIPVHDLLDRIYFEANLPERYRSAAPAHLRQRIAANLTRLLDLALELDSGRFPSLARFLSRLEALTREDSESLGGEIDHAGNQVRLLTIHAAKGLESPVVFLVDAARDVTKRDRKIGAIMEWPIDQPRPQCFFLPGRKAETDAVSGRLLRRQAAAALREEANLLYVALTRAQQMLFVSGCEPARRSVAGDPIRGWYGWIERRLSAAAATEPKHALELTRIDSRERTEVFNICGHIAYGSRPAVTEAPPVPARAPVAIDPALTRPFEPLATGSTHVRPSDAGQSMTEVGTSGNTAGAKHRGVVIHRMLECLSGTRKDREKARKKIWREFAAAEDEEWLAQCWQEACAVVDAPGFREFFDPDQYQDARNEVSILYRAEEQDMLGFIDRLIFRERDMVLIDYKTHHVGREQVAALASSYAPQLKLYADGVRRLWPGRPVKAVVLFTACCSSAAVAVD